MFQKFHRAAVPRKKVLALVLTLALALSVAAGAAFTDQKQIKNTEAVDACVALNIIGGYPDGSYKPEGNITRAEFTKMLCVLLNGGKEPTLGTAVNPTFSDVRTSANAAWAEKYIESCASLGIVSGVGGGKFAPNNSVTGSEAAKMLLVALGYKSDIETFTGAAWEVNVNVKATEKGLYDGLSGIDTSKALTRDNAAQMVWNALQAKEVKYEYTLVSENGQLVSKTTLVTKDITLLKDKYDCSVYEGELTGSGEYGDAAKDKISMDVEKIDGVDFTVPSNNTSHKTFKYDKDVTDLVGQYVKALVNNKGEAYGVYAVPSENLVVTTTFDKVKQDGDKIKVDGTSYKYDAEAIVKNVVKTAAAGNTPAVALKISDIGNEIAAGDLITFVSNDGDNKFDVAYVTPIKAFVKVTYVSKDKVTAGGVSYDADDSIIPDGLAKGDYVAVYADRFTGNDKLVKADKTTGEITATKNDKKDVKIGGNWYTAGNTTANQPFAGAVTAKGDAFQGTGDKFTIYSINGIVYFADKESSGSTDTAYVLAATGSMNADGDYQVKLLFADGNSKLIAADEAYTTLSGKLVTYEINSDNLYELEAVSDTNKAGGDSVVDLTGFDKSAKKVNTSSDSYRVSSTAIVYVEYKDSTDSKAKQKVITGAELNALGSNFGTSGKAVIDGGLATVVLLKSDQYLPGAKASQLYGYVTSTVVSEESEGGVKYKSFTVWTSEGKSVDVKMKGSTDVEKGNIISFDLTADNFIEGVKSSSASGSSKLEIVYGAIKDFTMGDYVTFYNKTTGATPTRIDLEMDDNVKYLFLNTDDVEGVADDTLVKATETTVAGQTGKYYYNNAVYVLDSGKIAMIACDVVNQYWAGQGADSNKVAE